MFSKLVSYVGDNAIQVDAGPAEEGLRKGRPGLLVEGERVVFAFQDRGGNGRDDKFFTDKRILTRNVQGMTGKMVKYQSIPYYSIKCFAVETAGSALDGDCNLSIHSSGLDKTSMDFVKGTDVFAIARFLNQLVLVDGSTGARAPAGAPATAAVPTTAGEGRVGSVLDWLGDDASQIDAAKAEAQLKRDPQLLMDDEKVELAFKCGRDSFLFTSKRILAIDVKGLSGTRVKYKSVLWKCLRAFSVESAGSWFDRDAEMTLFTNISDMSRISQDFRKGKVDLMAVQKFVADKLLGQDPVEASSHAKYAAGHVDQGPDSTLAWLGDDCRTIDAREAENKYKSDPPILQPSEHVEMAFKGRRDLVLFTSKRLLEVDLKGVSRKKVEYFSIPWANVQCFGVRSAGSWIDKDSEMMIWTDINDVVDGAGDAPPVPRKSFIEVDFQKDKVDLMAIHRYLSARCLRTSSGAPLPATIPVPPAVTQASAPSSVEAFLNWVGNDAVTLDAGEVDAQLHGECSALQEDERVWMAFKSGRDMCAFTTKRVLLVDVQGFTGKKVEWKSVPYSSLRAFAVESAGSWDRDAEFELYCKTYWADGRPGSTIKQDLRKGRADVIAIQAFLAHHTIGADDGSTTAVQSAPAGAPDGIDGFLAWIGNDAHEISAEEVNKKLREATPILQADEQVDLCFKVGRDMTVFTTKRVILVDVQGWSGKKVRYKSLPLKYCSAFAVRSPGSVGFLGEAFVSVHADVPGFSKFKQDLTKNKVDIWSIKSLLHAKLLR